MTGKHNSRTSIHVIVFLGELDLELEDTIGVKAPSQKYDTVKESEVMEGWYDVDSTGCVLFEVLVFNGHFVIAEGLFTFRL